MNKVSWFFVSKKNYFLGLLSASDVAGG